MVTRCVIIYIPRTRKHELASAALLYPRTATKAITYRCTYECTMAATHNEHIATSGIEAAGVSPVFRVDTRTTTRLRGFVDNLTEKQFQSEGWGERTIWRSGRVHTFIITRLLQPRVLYIAAVKQIQRQCCQFL